MCTKRVLWIALLMLPVVALAQTREYVIGVQDVVTVTVWNQPTLSGRFTVEADGTFVFPLVGPVPASGLTVREVERVLTERLAAGIVKAPQVRVTVEEHRSQRVVILGEVRTPGTYPLSRAMTLVEALAQAGSVTARAGEDLVLIRAAPKPSAIGGTGGADHSQILRIPLEDVTGLPSGRDLVIGNGDVVYVPAAPTAHVFGEVRRPGEYPIRRQARVLQLIALAGGLTDRGSKKDIRVVRSAQGKPIELKVQLDDVVETGDVIVVRARRF